MGRQKSSIADKVTELDVLISINKKMDKVIKSLAMNVVSSMDDELQKIKTLKALEFTSDEIGAFLGTSGTSVRTALSRSKNKPAKKVDKNDK